MVEKFKCNLQYMLPQHALSRMIAKLADCKIPLVKNTLIKIFVSSYNVDVTTAAIPTLNDYSSFNDFFTRALRDDARPIVADSHAIVSPADGTISQIGTITADKLLQAKGHDFSLSDLLGDEKLAREYQDGSFVTIYLAPHDYHRVHMPLDGKLLKTVYIPGRLFSVNNRSVEYIPQLFCRNERLISIFETKIGRVALIMVGAMLVAGIETVWSKAYLKKVVQVNTYEDKNIFLPKGSEMGRFKFGSTVILLFKKDTTEFTGLAAGQAIKMGSELARIKVD